MKFLFPLFILLALSGQAISAPLKPYSQGSSEMREIRNALEAVSHESQNHEIELGMMDERIKNQEDAINSVRKQLLDTSQINKDLVKASFSSLETKISALDSANKSLIADMGHLKAHANETVVALNQFKQKLQELDQMMASHSESLDYLQTALKSLTEVLQGSDQSKSYQIQPGDSLEKLARRFHTSVRAIKELNHLTNDRIVVGQTLQLP